MSQETIFKLCFVIAACSLSWSSAAYLAYSSVITLRRQRYSAVFFRNFFILFGVAFLGFAITSAYTNPITIIINNMLYLASFYQLKLGFSSLKGLDKTEYKKLKKESLVFTAILLILNPLIFHLYYDSHLIRTLSVIASATYYCVTSLHYLDKNNNDIGRNASQISVVTCISLMWLVLILLVFTENDFLYISALMISQCIVILLLFGSTLITFLGDASKQFRKEAITDYLTGLYNRRYLSKRLKEVVFSAQRHLIPISLIVVDIDHFKKVNDTYGHDAGDAVIKTIANILTDVIRGSDLAARLGGEEFCIMLPHTNICAAMLLAERMRQAIEDTQITYGGKNIAVTASFGVSEIDLNNSPDDALLNADAALYQSKSAGRNKVTANQIKNN
ncbi:MAG: GGDEF domain-containing protein [Thalassotalea sp.]